MTLPPALVLLKSCDTSIHGEMSNMSGDWAKRGSAATRGALLVRFPPHRRTSREVYQESDNMNFAVRHSCHKASSYLRAIGTLVAASICFAGIFAITAAVHGQM